MNALTRFGSSRSSHWFVTIVVGYGTFVDLLVYTSLIPVAPFYLNHKGYDAPTLIGWLFTSFSFGAVFSTILLAALSERFASRKWPFVAGSLVIITSQLMLWEAPSYRVMLIARVIQGISSAIAWIFGLALICDFSPPDVVGRHIGISLSGVAIGSVLGPPVGSLLYEHFGATGPLTLSVSLAGLDLIGRLLILERRADGPSLEIPQASEVQQVSSAGKVNAPSLIQIMKRMGKCPRLVCCFCLDLFTSGIVMSMIETSLPFHLKTDYSLTTTHVGLFLLIGGAPTFASSPMGGYLTDKFGAEWVITLGMALAIPWWLILFLHMKVGLLTAVYAIGRFITIGVYVSCTAEMAKASRKIEGVQYTHVYAVSLLAYGIGTVVGPIVSGQIYAHLHDLGWTVICIVIAVVRCLAIPFLFWWIGDTPLRKRLGIAVAGGEEESQL